ncbi:MAG TPA: hypothetical protein VIS74_04210, partial [Chthoniobacterales bacterium]
MPKFLFSLLLAVFFCSCAVTGSPIGQTQVRIKGYPVSLLQQKTGEVFTRDSFMLVQSQPDRMVFERGGGNTEEVFYGDWMKRNTAVRVTVHFIRKGSNDYLLRTDSRILRNPGSSFEDQSDLFDMQSLKYRRYLSEVKKELQRDFPAA